MNNHVYGVISMIQIGNASTTRHLYQLGTDKGQIEVFANSREQARKLAEKESYVVKDVNMVG